MGWRPAGRADRPCVGDRAMLPPSAEDWARSRRPRGTPSMTHRALAMRAANHCRERVRIWCLAACLVIAVLAPVPGAAQSGRTLVIGSEQDYPPFAVGTTDATAGGFTVE